MHYSFFFTVEPGNDVDNPVVETIKLASGILRGVHVSIPSGVNNTVRCCILNASVQLLPSNQDGYFSGDGVVIDASLWYDLVVNPNTLYFVGWSVDANYDHTIGIMLDVKEDNEPDMTLLQSKLVDVMDHLISMIKSYL